MSAAGFHAGASGGVARRSAVRATLLLAGGAAAVALRSAIGGRAAAASTPAALVFATTLLVLAGAAGWRVRRDPRWRLSALAGAAGAVLLLSLWLSAGARPPLDAAQHVAPLLGWTPVVAAVAIAEEIALRGALFTVVQEWRGAFAAVSVTSIAFGLAHIGLYGWAALPLDISVGLLLGGLRMLTGGVTAPAVAHTLADLAAGWLS